MTVGREKSTTTAENLIDRDVACTTGLYSATQTAAAPIPGRGRIVSGVSVELVIGEKVRRTETDAHGGDENLAAAPADLVQTRCHLPSTRCERKTVRLVRLEHKQTIEPLKIGRGLRLTASERVTESDRAAVDVGAVERETVDVDHVTVHRRKRLIDLKEVDVVLGDLAALENLGDSEGGTL